ncbi:unnamed protein product, partial [Effrenium voratum]
EEEEEDETMEAAPPAPPPSPWMRVLFVDVDGVLNTKPDRRLLLLEEEPCRLLKKLIQDAQAKLVLTSKWRKHKAYVGQVFENFGLLTCGEDLEATPFHCDETRRDLEILQWLNAHRGQVKAWFALDGHDLCVGAASKERLAGHVAHLQGGLQAEHVEQALAVLCEGGRPAPEPSPSDMLPMDEGLASLMQEALSLLSGPFHPPKRNGQCQGGGEFDRLAQEAKSRFAD